MAEFKNTTSDGIEAVSEAGKNTKNLLDLVKEAEKNWVDRNELMDIYERFEKEKATLNIETQKELKEYIEHIVSDLLEEGIKIWPEIVWNEERFTKFVKGILEHTGYKIESLTKLCSAAQQIQKNERLNCVLKINPTTQTPFVMADVKDGDSKQKWFEDDVYLMNSSDVKMSDSLKSSLTPNDKMSVKDSAIEGEVLEDSKWVKDTVSANSESVEVSREKSLADLVSKDPSLSIENGKLYITVSTAKWDKRGFFTIANKENQGIKDAASLEAWKTERKATLEAKYGKPTNVKEANKAVIAASALEESKTNTQKVEKASTDTEKQFKSEEKVSNTNTKLEEKEVVKESNNSLNLTESIKGIEVVNSFVSKNFEELVLDWKHFYITKENAAKINFEEIWTLWNSTRKWVEWMEESNLEVMMATVMNLRNNEKFNSEMYTVDWARFNKVFLTRSEIVEWLDTAWKVNNLNVFDDGSPSYMVHDNIFENVSDAIWNSDLDHTIESITDQLCTESKEKISYEDFKKLLSISEITKEQDETLKKLYDFAKEWNQSKVKPAIEEVITWVISNKDGSFSTADSVFKDLKTWLRETSFEIAKGWYSFDQSALKSWAIVKWNLEWEKEPVYMEVSEPLEIKNPYIAEMVSKMPEWVRSLWEKGFLVKDAEGIHIMSKVTGSKVTAEDFFPDGYETSNAVRDVIILALCIKVFEISAPEISIPSLNLSLPDLSIHLSSSASIWLAWLTVWVLLTEFLRADEVAIAKRIRKYNVSHDIITDIKWDVQRIEKSYVWGYKELSEKSYMSVNLDDRDWVSIYAPNDPSENTIEVDDVKVWDKEYDIKITQVWIKKDGSIDMANTILELSYDMPKDAISEEDISTDFAKNHQNTLRKDVMTLLVLWDDFKAVVEKALKGEKIAEEKVEEPKKEEKITEKKAEEPIKVEVVEHANATPEKVELTKDNFDKVKAMFEDDSNYTTVKIGEYKTKDGEIKDIIIKWGNNQDPVIELDGSSTWNDLDVDLWDDITTRIKWGEYDNVKSLIGLKASNLVSKYNSEK